MTFQMTKTQMNKSPAFLREELFELVDEWCQQLFGTEDKPEPAAYELARLAAEYAAAAAIRAAADEVIPLGLTPWNTVLIPLISAVEVRRRFYEIASKLDGKHLNSTTQQNQ